MTEPVSPAPRALTRRERRRMEAGAVVDVLMVCTGNICRSPLAEVALRAQLATLPVRVHSAGTQAVVGRGMTPQAIRLATAAGVDEADAENHRARYLVEPMLLEADLVLTMAAVHRDIAVHMTPSRQRRIMTVREFASLTADIPDEQVRTIADSAGSIPADRVTAVVTALAAMRTGESSPAHDVIDPYRQSDAVYQQSADELLPAVTEVARVLRVVLG